MKIVQLNLYHADEIGTLGGTKMTRTEYLKKWKKWPAPSYKKTILGTKQPVSGRQFFVVSG